ncbi:unnamed protein product [Thlaspi arvense]|uniref:Uncharacterized protein n=1 Tax=Thlaspi arvense TaxID=13288 RepID=A0AAU9SWG6_THLAR|nr:unnamed protein product [Thlaspi arvense]
MKEIKMSQTTNRSCYKSSRYTKYLVIGHRRNKHPEERRVLLNLRECVLRTRLRHRRLEINVEPKPPVMELEFSAEATLLAKMAHELCQSARLEPTPLGKLNDSDLEQTHAFHLRESNAHLRSHENAGETACMIFDSKENMVNTRFYIRVSCGLVVSK